jgi:hypothetical protein
MVGSRACSAPTKNAEACAATPMHDSPFCFWHSPDHADEAKEARRLGGLRRRREAAVSGAYDFDGLATVADIRRLLEVAAIDTLSLENSIARARTLAYLGLTAAKLLDAGELEERVAQLEAALGPRLVRRGR